MDPARALLYIIAPFGEMTAVILLIITGVILLVAGYISHKRAH